MLLLARLAPETTGAISDDGFLIGQFTVSGTLNLLAVCTIIGVLGGGVYLLTRGLMIGPRWSHVLSISIGPAVVVGAVLVHPEGVDFTLLRPTWLAIAPFVAIPGFYVALLTGLGERWFAQTDASCWLHVGSPSFRRSCGYPWRRCCWSECSAGWQWSFYDGIQEAELWWKAPGFPG